MLTQPTSSAKVLALTALCLCVKCLFCLFHILDVQFSFEKEFYTIAIMLSFSTWPFALLALPGSAVMQFTDLFLVDLTTNQNGGCMGREGSIQQSLADSSAMVKIALTAVTAYTSDGRARRLLDAWFNNPSQAQLDDIHSRGDSAFLRGIFLSCFSLTNSSTR